MNITIANRQRTKKFNTRVLRAIVSALLVKLEVTQGEIGVHLVGAAEMAGVNWQFLQHSGSTDVITFDHREAVLVPDHPELELYGELFVCVDDALKQAEAFRTTWTSEVVRYVVHGVLHLLGHDDLQPHLRRRMKREEERLLRWLETRFSFAELSGGVIIKT